MASASQKIAITNWWHGADLSDVCDTLDDLLARHPYHERLARSRKAWKGLEPLLLLYFGRNYPVVFTKIDLRGRFVIPLVLWLLGSRKLVALELIVPPAMDKRLSFARRTLALMRDRLVSICLRRVLLGAQVMTEWEIESISAAFGLDKSRLHYIPWPLNNATTEPLFVKPAAEPYVMSSGRASCDWETLFASAAKSTWPLVVVCARGDLERVQKLNADGRARVLVEVSLNEHLELVRNATVFALCLLPLDMSAGQIRLGNCNEAGTPAVASDVKSLSGYLIDNVNGIAVPPGDATALANAIDRLFVSPRERQDLARRAYEHSLTSTRRDMMDRLRVLITQCAAERDAGAAVGEGSYRKPG